jgi:hypothetical protein
VHRFSLVRGDETRVEQAFGAWLAAEGWLVGDPPPDLRWLDVLAEREGQRLYAEVKGRTAAIGTDVDTAYGQLLRRMPEFEDESVRYALVVPDVAETAALRVPARVREALRVDIYVVDEAGCVRAAS